MRQESYFRKTERHTRSKSPDSPAAVWKEKESLRGKPVDAGVVILRTSGCSHFHSGGCSMCGYNTESSRVIAPGDVLKQFEHATAELGEVGMIKLYTSGSFLDACEVPEEAAGSILKSCSDRGVRLLFESRPEYIIPGRMDSVLGTHEDIEVAIGLESSNDRVLRYSINKGFTVRDFDAAAAVLDERSVDLRSYVLLKPPYLTEAEAIADAISTVKHAAAVSSTVSVNPVNVQKGTVVEKLWRSWAYRPPWLWSVLEVLRSSASTGKRVVCDPTGGGKERGAHNCVGCDDVILHGIKAFSQSQDVSRLGAPECSCKDLWRSQLDLEGYVMGGTCDLQRFFRKHRA
jgi:hypothetical protein